MPKPNERASERTVATDENQGLAARLVELREETERQRRENVRDIGECKTLVARLEQRVALIAEKVDKAIGEITKTARELTEKLREGGEQVRASGELARKMTDQMRVLEELRAVAVDPYEVVKPLRKHVAEIEVDLGAFKRHTDDKLGAIQRVLDGRRIGDDADRQRAHDAERRGRVVPERIDPAVSERARVTR